MSHDTLSKDLKHAAKHAAAMAKDAGQDAMDDLKDSAKDLTSRTTEAAATLRDTASDRLESAGETLANGSAHLAKSLRNAADAEDGTLRASALDLAAEGASRVSETLRGKNLGALMSDVQGFARRNPAVFAAGAAIAGFALARVLQGPSSQQTTAKLDRTPETPPRA